MDTYAANNQGPLGHCWIVAFQPSIQSICEDHLGSPGIDMFSLDVCLGFAMQIANVSVFLPGQSGKKVSI